MTNLSSLTTTDNNNKNLSQCVTSAKYLEKNHFRHSLSRIVHTPWAQVDCKRFGIYIYKSVDFVKPLYIYAQIEIKWLQNSQVFGNSVFSQTKRKRYLESSLFLALESDFPNTLRPLLQFPTKNCYQRLLSHSIQDIRMLGCSPCPSIKSISQNIKYVC